MKRALLAGGAVALALSSTLVLAQRGPESLLPPGFDDPAPAPAPTPAATRAPQSQGSTSVPVVQPIPGGGGQVTAPSVSGEPIALPPGLPSLEELEALDPDELDELLGLKPKFDIPAGARRSMERVGVLDQAEGGLPAGSLAKQPAAIVRAALLGMKGRVVSRWGHIMLRRALASRLEAPAGMRPVEFAALRARALNQIGEYSITRALVQDVDTANWNRGMTNSALTAYLGTADITGACPAILLNGDMREDAQWQLWRSICHSFGGETARSRRDLSRAFNNGLAEPIDVLLAQRYAGAADRGGRSVNIEWDDVDELTPWRFALAGALGAEIPDNLLAETGSYYRMTALANPALPLDMRVTGAEPAAERGIISSAEMVDLYSEVHAEQGVSGSARETASRLREAYVAANPAARVDAIQSIWGSGDVPYGRYVLTAYAAARIAPSEALAGEAPDLIASMLSAGLDADALGWAQFAPQGGEAWAQLVLAQPNRPNPVEAGLVEDFVGSDDSPGQRKAAFFVAGLAGLGRIDQSAVSGFDSDLELGLGRETRWSRLITQAAAADNRALVALLAGVGMQGSSWDAMTPRHLYHIVSALNRVGLSAEARMIAAEAVARG